MKTWHKFILTVLFLGAAGYFQQANNTVASTVLLGFSGAPWGIGAIRRARKKKYT